MLCSTEISFDYNLLTGVSLIMEGIMSSLYHICPTNANFQFGKTLSIHWYIRMLKYYIVYKTYIMHSLSFSFQILHLCSSSVASYSQRYSRTDILMFMPMLLSPFSHLQSLYFLLLLGL